ncbi:MAG: HAMP domain-containing histidine kinase [Campylobacteraceae bacterium]|nr:HAMP domain-containing histidine kinase [Campylobacteraceae bacterium]
MQKLDLNKEDLIVDDGFLYGLYSQDQKVLQSEIKEKIDFSKDYYQDGENTYYIDKGAAGHLGVTYVVLKESNLNKKISELLLNIIVIIVVLYMIIALIGFYLARLFIYPIQSQREKLDIFIKNTTHELNTPLSAILLCVDSKNFYSEQNRNHIKVSVKKMTNIYKDLTYLFFSQEKQLEADELNISQVLRKELEYHTELASMKHIDISNNIEETFFTIDEESFIRITNNLISNAIKYTKRKGAINITLEKNALIIKDTGIGIDNTKLEKIFERYYRATNSVGGFGIGLDIVYSICKKYNIKIDVKSELNVGTTFTLKFPSS